MLITREPTAETLFTADDETEVGYHRKIDGEVFMK